MDLQTAARQYLGVKFHHQGRQPWALDCGGLLIIAANDLGVTLSDVSGYSRMPDGVTLKATMDKQLTKVNRKPQPNDILLMAFRHNPQHIGIVTDLNGKLGIIHAFEGVKEVTEHILDDVWLKRIKAVYTL